MTDLAALPADLWPASVIAPRARIVIDNDFSGDPDGLVQLAQHALSPSVDLRVVIGSHLRAGDPWDPSPNTAERAVEAARRVLELAGRRDVPLAAGSNVALAADGRPIRSDGASAIVEEAMRDSDLPLFVVCGAGLTELASAWLIEPRIADRLTVVWIGGHEHDGLAEAPQDAPDMEYNLDIDPLAGRIVFNDSNLSIWQVPRDMYRSVLASRAELLTRLWPHGELGRHLVRELAEVARVQHERGRRVGETYVLGDSPLVLLTALMTAFEPTPASSSYVTMPCPKIAASGLYEPDPAGRPLRVYTRLDSRLLLDDLYAKLELHAAATNGAA